MCFVNIQISISIFNRETLISSIERGLDNDITKLYYQNKTEKISREAGTGQEYPSLLQSHRKHDKLQSQIIDDDRSIKILG